MQQEKLPAPPKKNSAKAPRVFLRYTDQTEDLPPLSPEKVFFTADTHFFGSTVLRHRPGFPDIRTMNETLIRNWNETVPEDGVVFHLGDFATELPARSLIRLINRLHGTILLVKGNHDDITLFRSAKIQQSTRLQVLGYKWKFKLDHIRILLDHYPYLCYEDEYQEGVWQLFGHVHSGPESSGFDIPRLQYLLPFQYDVGVDNNENRPVSFLRLKEIMAARQGLERATPPNHNPGTLPSKDGICSAPPE